MKKTARILLVTMIISVFAVMSAYAAGMEKMKGEMKGESYQSIRATNFIGASVINKQDENLGKISDLFIDQKRRVTFAILSHGGMLGIGEKLIPVPIGALTIRDEKTVIIDTSKDKLATAPNFAGDKWPDMTNRQWTEDTYRFYGVQPYWMEKGMEKEMKRDMKEKGMERKPMY